jgi:hypothetical protein
METQFLFNGEVSSPTLDKMIKVLGQNQPKSPKLQWERHLGRSQAASL